MTESLIVVNKKATPEQVQAAVDRLGLPDGVRWINVIDDSPEYVGYQTEVWLHGPDADECDGEYARRLSEELGVSVLTSDEVEAAVMKAHTAARPSDFEAHRAD